MINGFVAEIQLLITADPDAKAIIFIIIQKWFESGKIEPYKHIKVFVSPQVSN